MGRLTKALKHAASMDTRSGVVSGRKAILKKKYGMTPEQAHQFFLEHDYRCAICGRHRDSLPRGLCIDHCHKTGRVRGALCGHCNTGLGMFLDSTELLASAIGYLTARGTQ